MATQNADSGMGKELPPAVIEDLLSDESRRRALEILSDRNEPMVVEELAASVVAARAECPVSAVRAADREAMTEELFTEHIPKLTATGVVAYDSMLGAVELRQHDIVR